MFKLKSTFCQICRTICFSLLVSCAIDFPVYQGLNLGDFFYNSFIHMLFPNLSNQFSLVICLSDCLTFLFPYYCLFVVLPYDIPLISFSSSTVLYNAVRFILMKHHMDQMNGSPLPVVQLPIRFQLFATHGLQHARLPCPRPLLTPTPKKNTLSCSSKLCPHKYLWL